MSVATSESRLCDAESTIDRLARTTGEQACVIDALELKIERLERNPATIEGVKNAIRTYHNALNRREHGGIAQDECIKSIERVLGMRWQMR